MHIVTRLYDKYITYRVKHNRPSYMDYDMHGWVIVAGAQGSVQVLMSITPSL